MVLDIEAVRKKRDERDARQEKAIAWCVEALSEFEAAARELQTPPRGNPDFLKNVYGQDAYPGVWPILRADDPDNILIQIGHGASLTMSGQFWVRGKAAPAEDVAVWIAARCGYSIEVLSALFEAALLGESWNVKTALSQW